MESFWTSKRSRFVVRQKWEQRDQWMGIDDGEMEVNAVFVFLVWGLINRLAVRSVEARESRLRLQGGR